MSEGDRPSEKTGVEDTPASDAIIPAEWPPIVRILLQIVLRLSRIDQSQTT
jgi:hypothetical protein